MATILYHKSSYYFEYPIKLANVLCKCTTDVKDRILIQLVLKVFGDLRSSVTSTVHFTLHINQKIHTALKPP